MARRRTRSDRTNILTLHGVANLPLPAAALHQHPRLSAHSNEAIIEAFRRVMGHVQARLDLIWRSRAWRGFCVSGGRSQLTRVPPACLAPRCAPSGRRSLEQKMHGSSYSLP